MGWLAKYYSDKRLLMISFTMYLISMLLIPQLGNVYLLFLPILLFGTAIGINMPVIQIMLAELAPVNVRAAIMSINGMVLRLGQTLGPVVIGSVFDAFGFVWAFYAGAFVAVVMLICAVFLFKREDSSIQ
jgi:MFS family permease